MVTCMETWLLADQVMLRSHYVNGLQDSALPPLFDLENRSRHLVQDALVRATRNCKNFYKKGERSFILLGIIRPAEVGKICLGAERCERILKARCK